MLTDEALHGKGSEALLTAEASAGTPASEAIGACSSQAMDSGWVGRRSRLTERGGGSTREMTHSKS